MKIIILSFLMMLSSVYQSFSQPENGTYVLVVKKGEKIKRTFRTNIYISLFARKRLYRGTITKITKDSVYIGNAGVCVNDILMISKDKELGLFLSGLGITGLVLGGYMAYAYHTSQFAMLVYYIAGTVAFVGANFLLFGLLIKEEYNKFRYKFEIEKTLKP